MAVITLPSKVYFTQVDKFQLLRSSVTLRSKYTGKRQVVTFPFAVWVFEATLIPMDGADAAEWRSFLVELEGAKNTFRLPVPGHISPLTGYAGPQGTTSAVAASRAKSITTSGWTPNAALLTRGDYFTINDELKICTGPVSANGAGQATISFEPGLRKALTAGVVVQVYNPFILLSAQREDVAEWRLEHPVEHTMKLSAIEAF